MSVLLYCNKKVKIERKIIIIIHYAFVSLAWEIATRLSTVILSADNKSRDKEGAGCCHSNVRKPYVFQ